MVSKYHNGLIQSGMCKNTAVFYMHNVKAVYKKGCREFGLDFFVSVFESEAQD